MVVVMRNESFCPGTYALIKCFGYGLVWEQKGDTMRVEGGKAVAFDECESMNNGKEVSLYLKVILRDVDGNNRVTLVGRDDFLEENLVLLSQKWKPRLGR